MNHGQPQSGPLPLLLRGEERIEYLGDRFFTHAGTAVGHLQARIRSNRQIVLLHARQNPLRLQGNTQDPAFPPHGLLGVRTQVQDDLVDPGRIREDGPRHGIELLTDFNGRRQGGAQELESLLHHDMDPDGLSVQLALTAEGKDLLDQLLSPVSSLHHLSEVGDGGRVGIEIVQCELREAEHGRQDVVEVVGDATGESPHGFHLLGLQELFFELRSLLGGPSPLRHIMGNAFHGDHSSPLVEDRRVARFHPDALSVPVFQRHQKRRLFDPFHAEHRVLSSGLIRRVIGKKHVETI